MSGRNETIEDRIRRVVVDAIEEGLGDRIVQAIGSAIDTKGEAFRVFLEEHRFRHRPYLTRADIAVERRCSVDALYHRAWLLPPGAPDGKIGMSHVWHVDRCRAHGLIGPNMLTDCELRHVWRRQITQKEKRPQRARREITNSARPPEPKEGC